MVHRCGSSRQHMARLFRWFGDFRRKKNRGQNGSSSPQPSSRATGPCKSRSSPQTTVAAAASSSRRFDCKSRWSKQYDVCICHAEDDVIYVQDLVAYLELRPHSLRCFLQLRDLVPGGAICTELCQAVRQSHCWVLVISPAFIKDPWCGYQMQQALSESPKANGRVIPVRMQLERKDYPLELRFMFGIDVGKEKENGFQRIKRAILYNLEELCRKNGEEQQHTDAESRTATAGNTADSSGPC